ncbi:MAG: DNA-directed RNA polymerase subunit omega [Gammaproteobacteria bacterium]
MSRTTIADCLEECPNHFNLAYHAAQRAHNILRRGDAQVPENNDRPIIVALREVAAGAYVVEPLKSES